MSFFTNQPCWVYNQHCASQAQVQDSRRSARLLLPSMSRSRALSAKSSGFEAQWQTRRASEGKAIEKRDALVLVTPNAPLTERRTREVQRWLQEFYSNPAGQQSTRESARLITAK